LVFEQAQNKYQGRTLHLSYDDEILSLEGSLLHYLSAFASASFVFEQAQNKY
jgi:hypothetical protein